MELDKLTRTDLESAQPVRSIISNIASCGHPICPFWKATSKDGKPCPCCVANDHIAEIKKIQAGIENRGGVFVSKRQHHYDAQLMSHKDWMKQWQRAKVLCAGAIELLSQLNDNHPEHAEKWRIKEALHIWNSAAEDCGQVLGYRYVQEKLENSGHEDGRSVRVRKDDSHDEMSLAAQELQELWADNREWVIRPKRKSRKSRHTSSTASPTLDFGFSRTVNNAFDSKSWHIQRAAKDVTSVDDDVLKDMEDVTDRLNDQLNMGNWNISRCNCSHRNRDYRECGSKHRSIYGPSSALARQGYSTFSPENYSTLWLKQCPARLPCWFISEAAQLRRPHHCHLRSHSFQHFIGRPGSSSTAP
jgi:ferredoxin-thioredoxin reductase catalytic subunit